MASRATGYFDNLRDLVTHILALFLFSFFFYGPLLQAGVYKWTDEQGRVHFSDRPVSESSTEVKIKKAPTRGPGSNGSEERQLQMKRMLDVYQEDRANKKEARTKAKKEREKRKAKCIYAKDRYKSHSRATGIYGFNKEGKRSYLDDEQRKSHMKRLKADVDRWCK
jgi:hypothetical protein